MKLNHLLLLLTFVTPYSYACNFHQSTGFSFITEPGSLDVFERVIEMRQSEQLVSYNSFDPLQTALYPSFTEMLHQPFEKKINFTIFEAIIGHYSEINLNSPMIITDREQAITESDLLLITEWDVLDTLVTRTMSWQQVKQLGLVKINGKANEIIQLDEWFTVMFPEPQ
ncbi:MAG: hypothetical protein V7782_14635 [Psychromonas sp.]